MSSDVMDGQAAASPAETGAEPVTPAEQPSDTAAEGGEQKQEQPKTFTQEDIDRAVRLRVAREQRRYERRIGDMEAQLRAQPQPTQSNASAEPQLDQFKSWDEYQRALTRFEAEKIVEERERKRGESESQRQYQQRMAELSAAFEKREDKAREAFDDYDDVVGSVPKGLIANHVIEFIGESDVGPQVLYALANDLTKARELSRMSPMAAARALAKIEAEIASPKPVSKAPAPVAPPKGASASASDGPSDKDDPDTWMRKRQAQLKARA